MAFFSHRLCARSVTVFAATTLLAVSSFCQAAAPGSGQKSDPAKPPEPNGKRVFWIIPNYRTFPTLTNYKPITPKEKFKIAMDDSYDRGTAVLAAAFAGERQLTNSNPSFGQGVKGYSRYFGTAYADLVIGDFMTEAVYPTILHQDPRYFRRGTGGGRHAVQLFGNRRQLDGGGDFERVLSGGARCEQRGVGTRFPDRRRYGCQHPERVLAGFTPEVFSRS